jgi:hypothetical protein
LADRRWSLVVGQQFPFGSLITYNRTDEALEWEPEGLRVDIGISRFEGLAGSYVAFGGANSAFDYGRITIFIGEETQRLLAYAEDLGRALSGLINSLREKAA